MNWCAILLVLPTSCVQNGLLRWRMDPYASSLAGVGAHDKGAAQ